MKPPRAVILMGLPCAGKTTYALSERFVDFAYISPEAMGATVPGTVGHNQLRDRLRFLIYNGQNFIVDHTNHTRTTRQFYLDLIQNKLGKKNTPTYLIECHYLRATLGECSESGKRRQSAGGERVNRRLLIGCQRNLEEPLQSEGFTSIIDMPFKRSASTPLVNRAVFFGFDGVIRYAKGYHSYPQLPEQVRIFDGVNRVLRRYYEEGYKLIGLCRQPAVETNDLTEHAARECMLETVRQLESPVDDVFLCTHLRNRTCLCHPYMIGLAAEKHCLDMSRCILVGNSLADMRALSRFQFGRSMHRTDFFGSPKGSEAKAVLTG